jgi:dipeptidyl aminopeptidase/acylaminoacyl peptidase
MRLFLLALLLASAPASAAREFEYLAMSPKGEAVAAVESDGGAHGTIVVHRTSDGRVLRTLDPCTACAYSDLVFAADGRLAFLSRDRAAGNVSLNVADSAGHLRTVATIKGLAEAPRFAPDGKRIALLVTLNATKETGAAQAGARQVGEIGETSDEKRIAVFDVAGTTVGDAVKPVSPAGRYVYEYAWTPDGKRFVASTALGNGDANWWAATIDAIDAQTGAVRLIAKPPTQVRFPRISPDGKMVAYVGGLMSDYSSAGGDVWTVPFAGGTPVDRTPDLKATITSLVWLKDGLRGTMLAGADAALVRIDSKGAVARLWSKPAGLTAGDARAAFSLDGRKAASVVQDYEHAAAVYAGPVAEPSQITHDNDALPALVHARNISWTNGGLVLQGWLLAPADADPAVRAPMIVTVHGGPASASIPNYIAEGGTTADLVHAGYYVFYPNPRGSFGQGEAFTIANKRDFGGGDLKDILAGVDAVEKVAPIDENRLGLIGGSYGGFMAMWVNTQTDRFKAIVAGAGVSDWISYYGINGIDRWMIPYFGKSIYDDPKAYWDVSAIQFIKRAKTPTFLAAGERDIEVPPTQSIEYWHALREMGVPTSLVIYPGEGHRVRDPAHSADLRKRTVAWFDTYVKRDQPPH